MLLDKIYVPENCLQGEQLPVYILWPKDKKIKRVIINLPNQFELLDVHNATVEKSEESQISISNFQENGYLGLVIKTKQLYQPAKDESIFFKAISNEGESQEEKRIVHLFRPSVKVKKIPNKIVIRKSQSHNQKDEDTVQLSNEGEGIALIGFRTTTDSEIEIQEPAGIIEFWNNFNSDLKQSFEEYKKTETKNAEFIDLFLDFRFKNYPEIDEEEIKRFEETRKKISEALSNDSLLKDKFIELITVAITKNIRYINQLDGFLSYLKSVESSKVLIMDPLATLRVTPEIKKFKAKLFIVDLAYTTYPPTEVNIDLSSNENCDIPIYKLLKVLNND